MQVSSRPRRRDSDNAVGDVLDGLRRIVRAARSAAHEAESRLGISGAQHFVLQQLSESPAHSLNELAERTRTHKSSVSVVVSRLVALGYVSRERSEADARAVELRITPAGRAALKEAPESAQSRFISALESLPPEELESLARSLTAFTQAIGLRNFEPLMLFEESGSGAPHESDAAPRPGNAGNTQEMAP